jgi:transposase
MSLHRQPVKEIPVHTAEVARAAFPKGNPYMTLRDELGPIFEDEQFADLFPTRGKPAIAPWQLAFIMLMQFAEDLTDRQTAEQVRARIDWKYALGLELTDSGFDFSVLSEFRARLIEGAAETRLLNRLLDIVQERGWVKAGGRQRTDSTHVLAAVRQLNRLEVVGETLHHALNVLAQIDPEWLVGQAEPEWWERYAQRFSAYRFPSGEEKQLELAEVIGRDGYHVLTQIFAEEAPPHLRSVPAVNILRQVWTQQFFLEDDQVRWRSNKNVPPAAKMIASPYDVEVRLSQKRGKAWQGYKVHLTETCDPKAPHLITQVETTLATLQDNDALPAIHEQLEERALLPGEHLVDGGYQSVDGLLDSEKKHGIDLLGPMRPDGSWQARDDDAYDLSKFTVNWGEETVTCPQGKKSRYWKETSGSRGQPIVQVVYNKKECLACEARALCTKSVSAPRYLTFHPREKLEALQAAREYQQTDEFKERYKKRAGVEGTISQAAFTLGMRRTRYRGLAKTHLHHIAIAAAINVSRIVNWFLGEPHAMTRVSHFARLAPAV